MSDIAAVNQVLITATDETGPATASASSNIRGVGTAVDSLSGQLESAARSATAFLSMASVAAVLEHIASESYNVALSLQQMAERTGSSVATLSAIRDAATLSGASFDIAAGAIDKLGKSAATSTTGTLKAADAFKALGISTTDVNGVTKDSGALFQEVALALDHYQDGAAKVAVVTALMGRGAAENIPLLHQMAQSLAESNTVTPEAAANAEALQRAWGALKIQSEAAANSIIDPFIPALTQLIEKFTIASAANVTFGDKLKFWASNALAYETLGLLGGGALDVTTRLKDVNKEIDDITAAMIVLGDKSDAASKQEQGNLALELGLLQQKKKLLDEAAIKSALAFAAGLGDTSDHGQYLRPGGPTPLVLPSPVAKVDFSEIDKLRGEIATLDAETAKYNDTLNGVAATDTALNKVISDYDQRLEKLAETHGTLTQAEAALWDALAKSAIATDAARLAVQAHNEALALAAKFIAALNTAMTAATSATQQYADKIADIVSKSHDEVEAIGMSASAIKVLSDTRKIDIDLRTLQEKLTKDMTDLDTLETAALTDQTGVLGMILDAKRAQISADMERANGAAAAAKVQIAADQAAQDSFSAGWAKAFASYQDGLTGAKIAQEAFNGLAQSFETLIEGALSHAANAWKTFTASVIQLIEQIAAKLATSGIFQLLSTGSINVSGLFGGASGSTGVPGTGLLSSLFGDLPSFGTALSNISGGLSTFTTLLEGGTSLFEAGSAAIAGLGSSVLALAGPIGIVAAIALPLLSGLFKSGGGPKGGGSASTDAATVFAGQDADGGSRFYTPNDADAALQDSVKTLQASYNNILASLGGKGTAQFALGYDTDPKGTASDRIKVGATVDGQQAYSVVNEATGRDSAATQAELQTQAQRALLAALQQSDLPKYVADLLNSVNAGTATPQQITDILNTAQALKTAVETVGSLGGNLAKLNPDQIQGLVAAFGDLATFTNAQNYLAANFTTTADKVKSESDQLNASFASLGVAVPKTHAAFLDMLNGIDLTTDGGQKLYASLTALAPAFVDVYGTADQAAQALEAQAEATQKLVDTAQQFFDANFYTAAEQQSQKLAGEIAQVTIAQAALGVAIPTTVDGFRALIESIDQTTPAGAALYASLIVLAPAIFDIATQAGAAGSAITTAANDISDAVQQIQNLDAGGFVTAADALQTFEANIKSLADNLTNASLGDKLTFQIQQLQAHIQEMQAKDQALLAAGDLFDAGVIEQTIQTAQGDLNQLAKQLANFTILSAQYGPAMAEQLVQLQDWYAGQQALFQGNAAALAALQTIFQQKWNDIIAGTSDGVDGTLTALAKLRDGIKQYLQSLVTGDLSPLSPAQKLQQAQQQYEAEYQKALGGDQGALGDISKYADQYLQLARDSFASSQQYTDIFNLIFAQLTALTNAPIVTDPPPGTPPPGGGGGGGSTTTTTNLSALTAALPVQGKLVSADDISAQTKALIAALFDGFKAHADAGTTDTETVTTKLDSTKTAIVDAVRSGKK